MSSLNIERQNKLQPERIEYAKRQLEQLGYDMIFESETELRFKFNDQTVRFFPFTGWFTGKSVKDGRGITNLLNQIK